MIIVQLNIIPVIFVVLQVKWQTVLWGIALQFVFALFVLRWQAGRTAFEWLGFRFTEFLGYSDFGAEFVFGASFREHFVAFQVILLLHTYGHVQGRVNV